ncbi:hypothetical protein MM300_17720 [Evansella sp. LMS18]|uniref:hypothetical protein n=1 Tax=Evansella sp. LMS18 TaxID=2924033 RepID=UPI0020D03C47|nr:hypothetical protein [Evansella sp. LMS18]UTR09711.1 hypothetical protein MM300_17720 [Evansella sp. LMS18]
MELLVWAVVILIGILLIRFLWTVIKLAAFGGLVLLIIYFVHSMVETAALFSL